MDANPAPTATRLERAERLVEDAAKTGAKLVVLPEIFNTGYTYDESLVGRAETAGGPTTQWLEKTSNRLGVHLAGSFLFREGGDVFNTLLIVAPNGRQWRYDKVFPWGWERSAFRGSRNEYRIAMADTDLGRIGMLVCWDSAHPELWADYAGKIDFMLIASCPIDATDPTYHLADGTSFGFDDVPLVRGMKGSEDELFGKMINEQTAWLGVPAVNTVGCGRIRTPMPRGRLLGLSLVPVMPRLAKALATSGELEMSADATPGCKVIDARGRSVAELVSSDGESFTSAEVTLADQRPKPSTTQPETRLSKAAYVFSDIVLPGLMVPIYERGVERAFGTKPTSKRASLTELLTGVRG